MLELEGIRDPDTTTNIIREALWLAFQVDPASISFVDISDGFDPKINPEPGGDPESQDKGPPMRKAYVGFNVQMAAKNLELEVEGIEGGKKFIVNEEVVTFRVLSHKKESEYRTRKFGSPEESKQDQSLQEHNLNCLGPGHHDSSKDKKGEGHKSGESFSENWVTLDEL